MRNGSTPVWLESGETEEENEIRRLHIHVERVLLHVREHQKQQRAPQSNYDPKTIRNMLAGYGGEMAFAKWLGVPWVGVVGKQEQKDVAEYEVRTRQCVYYDLLIRPRDVKNNPDTPYVLVVTDPAQDQRMEKRLISDVEVSEAKVFEEVMTSWRFWLVGWIFAKEAPKHGDLKDRGAYGAPAYWVPQNQLRRMSEIERGKE